MPTSFWRSPETIERLNRLERPGFAVEFLRRNPRYRRDYKRTMQQIARGVIDAETARSALARRWGLCFRP
jgi:hypothetical protein